MFSAQNNYMSDRKHLNYKNNRKELINMKTNNYVFLKGILTNCHPTVKGNTHFDLEITDKNNSSYTVNINVRSRIIPHDVLYFIKQNYQNDIVDRCFGLDDTVHTNLVTGEAG